MEEPRADLETAVSRKHEEVSENANSTSLLDARDLVRDVRTAHSNVSKYRAKADAPNGISNAYERIVEDYVTASTADVETAFDAISDDVASYFHVLEATTKGIKYELIRSEVRIEEGGEVISTDCSEVSGITVARARSLQRRLMQSRSVEILIAPVIRSFRLQSANTRVR